MNPTTTIINDDLYLNVYIWSAIPSSEHLKPPTFIVSINHPSKKLKIVARKNLKYIMKRMKDVAIFLI
jgi:hypothetical protein